EITRGDKRKEGYYFVRNMGIIYEYPKKGACFLFIQKNTVSAWEENENVLKNKRKIKIRLHKVA
ncbi:MAG: hypothetical protein PHC40_08020, partial [Eubacteriales bacterium]|nr:hypothetical protein [Eubacteriales bacterium]